MADLFRFAAFISYSSKDAAFAKRLHRELESYHIPSALGSYDLIGGGKKNRIFPVFRDREELPSGELGEQIDAALKASAALIVVCSPNAAASKWVNAEIERFLALGRRDRIFAIIADTAPLLAPDGTDATNACFPAAFRSNAAGAHFEPIAADARKGKDGFRHAWLKVVAGLVSVNAGALADRDRKRRRARLSAFASATALLSMLLITSVETMNERARRVTLEGLAKAASEGPSSHEAAAFAVAALVPRGAIANDRRSAQDAAAAAGLSLPLLAVLMQGDAVKVSQDGERVLFRGLDGQTYIYERSKPVKQRLRPLGEHRVATMTPDGKWIAAQDWAGDIIRIDAQGQRRSLGRMQIALTFDLKDGGILVAESEEGDLRLIDLESAAVTRLAVKNRSYRIEVSRNGGIAFVQDRDMVVQGVAVRDGTIWSLGAAPEGWQITPDGRLFFRGGPDRLYRAYDARTGRPLAMAPIDGFEFDFGGSGRLAVLERETNSEIILSDGSLLASFPQPATVTFNYTASSLRLRNGDDTLIIAGLDPTTAKSKLGDRTAWANVSAFVKEAEYDEQPTDKEHLLFRLSKGNDAIDVLDLRSGAVKAIGVYGDLDPYHPFDLSHQGERLLVRPNLGFRSIVNIAPRTVGRLMKHQGELVVSAEFNTVAMTSPDLTVSVWDGSTALQKPLLTAASICEASQGIRPFSSAQRIAHDLVGRPWNACDWRGLGAIFPSREYGDSWFEGPIQFLRRIAVRYFGAKDYSCEDSVGAASPGIRALRSAGCQLARTKPRIAVSN